jgi:hypothetical protein
VGVAEKVRADGPKRLLALDGGGIRGLIAVEILGAIEQAVGSPLADYFDYVAGTSTGAILASCISKGMSVREIRDCFDEAGELMFKGASVFDRPRHKYSAEPLSSMLKKVFATGDGRELRLGSPELRTLLLLVLRNATTDSPWPLSNNPAARFNDRSLPDCNLDLPLWRLVRASTAAPTYFPPEEIHLADKEEFLFVDGGVTSYNNPAFLLFLAATLEPYRLEWPTGPENLLLVSVGTGFSAKADASLRPAQMHLFYSAKSVPSALIASASVQQDLLCRVFGRCLHGGLIDGELGDLRYRADRSAPGLPQLFTYLRYTADVSRSGLDAIGLVGVDVERVDRLDAIDSMADLRRVGVAAARAVDPAHFAGFERPFVEREPVVVGE